MEKPENKVNMKKQPMSRGKKLVIWLVSVILGLAALALLAIYVVIPLIASMTGSNGDITIGDITITREQIEKNAGDMQEFLDNNPDASFGDGDIWDIARDDLIMNAALVYTAKQCEVTISNEDIIIRIGYAVEDTDKIDDLVGLKGTYHRIREENAAYQEKMEDCVIASKDILVVDTMYDTPYYRNMEADEAHTAFESAKKDLKDKYLRMFEARMSSEEIIKSVYPPNGEPDPSMYGAYRAGTASRVEVVHYTPGIYIDNFDIQYPASPGNIVGMNDTVDALSEVGQYTTDVVVGANGAFSLVRVEHVSKGTYATWEDFLNYFKEEYTKDDFFAGLVNGVNDFFGSFINAIGKTTGVIGEDAHAWNYVCGGGEHRYILHLDMVLAGSSTTYLPGAASVSGRDLLQIGTGLVPNCPQLNPYPTGSGNADPSTGRYMAMTGSGYGFYNVDCGYDLEVTVTQNGGYAIVGLNGQYTIDETFNGVRYVGELNENRARFIVNGYSQALNKVIDVYIKVTLKPLWRVEPTSSVDRSIVRPGETATFYHSLTVRDANMNGNTTTGRINQSGDEAGEKAAFGGLTGSQNQVLINNHPVAYIPTNEDVGKTVCQTIGATPGASGGGTNTSSPACVLVVPWPWSVQGSSQIRRDAGFQTAWGNNAASNPVKVRPSDIVRFQHDLSSNNQMHRTTDWNIYFTDTSGGITGGSQGSGASQDNGAASDPAGAFRTLLGWQVKRYPTNSAQRVSQNDVGTYICQRITFLPSAYALYSPWHNNTTGYSNNVCAFVPYNYEPIPSIPVGGGGPGDSSEGDTGIVVEPGETVTLIPKLEVEDRCSVDGVNDAAGNPECYATKTKNSEWNFVEFQVTPDNQIPHLNDVIHINNGDDGGRSIDGFENGDGNPCSTSGANYFVNNTATPQNKCTILGSGTGTYSPTSGGTHNVTNAIERLMDEDAPVGTKICWALSVRPASSHSSEGTWRHSKPTCVTIGKKPKLQVHSAGVYTNDIISTSQTLKGLEGSKKLYGSWVEYEAIAAKLIYNGSGVGSGRHVMASGSAFSNWGLTISYLADQDRVARYSKETLANVDNGNTQYLGNYALDDLPSIAARYNLETITTENSSGGVSVGGETITINSNYASDNIGVRNQTGSVLAGTGSSNMHITSTSGNEVVINKRSTLVIVVDGNAYIDTNIRYTSETLNNIAEVPQVLILAKNIYIHPDVTNLDAWLVAYGNSASNASSSFIPSGEINTCYKEYDASVGHDNNNNPITSISQLNAYKCDKQLKVNGPTMAGTLKLFRTAGSGTRDDSGTPAEIFNLREDAYLWAYNQAAQSGVAITTYTRELAPRY